MSNPTVCSLMVLKSNKLATTKDLALDSLSYSGNAVTAAYYHRSVTLPLESLQPLVYNTLSRVVLELPAMGATLHHAIQFIQLRDGREEEVDRLVEEQQNIGFPVRSEQVPSWRLIIAYPSGRSTISDMVACFVVGASAKDQLCAVEFHRSFLAALLLANEAKLSIQPSEYLSPKDSKGLSGISTSRPGKQTSHIQRHSRFKTVKLGTADTACLLVGCLSRKIDITGVMQAVLAASLFANLTSEFSTLHTAGQILPSGTIKKSPVRIPCSRYIAIHNRAQGWPVASIWSEARRIHTASKAELSGKPRSSSLIGVLRREGGSSLFNTNDNEETSEVSVAVSSVGSFRDPKSPESQEQGEWNIGRMISSNDSNDIGAALRITLVVGGDGCLTMGFSWLEGVTQEVWLDRVIVTMKRLTRELLRNNGGPETKPMTPETLPWGGSVSRLVCVVRDLILD